MRERGPALREKARGITAGLSEVRAKTCGFIRYWNVSKPGEAGGKVALGVARGKGILFHELTNAAATPFTVRRIRSARLHSRRLLYSRDALALPCGPRNFPPSPSKFQFALSRLVKAISRAPLSKIRPSSFLAPPLEEKRLNSFNEEPI